MTDKTVASVFLKTLKKHGIRHIFGLPTIQIAMMQDGFGRDPFFSYVSVRHEESLGHMASGVAKTSPEMALCFATVGTGVANMLPGIAAAARDNVPMIALTANNHVKLIEPAIDYMQTIDQMALFKPITKWGAGLRQSERTVHVLEQVINRARIGCPGPVQIDVPFDLHTMSCDVDPNATHVLDVPRPVASESEIEKVVGLLRSARRPLLIAGGGVARSGAVEEFRGLVAKTGATAITTMNGYGALPPNCPTEAGCCGWYGGYGLVKACQEADLIVSFGCRFSLFMPISKPLYPSIEGQEIVQFDINPEQFGAIANTKMGIVADARESLSQLLSALEGIDLDLDEDWIDEVVKERKRFFNEINALADEQFIPGTQTLNEAAIARAFVDELPDDAIVAVDGGQCVEWSTTLFRPMDPYHFAANPGMGHLGFGLPAAIGAKLANPDKVVATMTGDGAFGMTIQELETAVRYNVNLIVLVYNDSKWGMYERPNRNIFKNPNFGTDMSPVNYAQIARGFGCVGVSVTTLEELRLAVRKARERDGVTVIDIPTEYTPHPMDEVWRPVNTANAVLRPVEL